MNQKKKVDKSLILEFTTLDEPILSRCSFQYPGLSEFKTERVVEGPLTSSDDLIHDWCEGLAAVCILILRSVAAGLEGRTAFWDSIPKEQKRTKKKKDLQEAANKPDHPAKMVQNLLSMRGDAENASYLWAWRLFGKQNEQESFLPKLFRASTDRVSMRWDALSPAEHIIVKSDGVELTDPRQIRDLAREIEANRFPDVRRCDSNVRPRSSRLFGREEEYEAISQLLSEHRLITFTGPAGVGKTELCYEIARQAEHVYRHVRVVELGNLDSSSNNIIPDVAEQLSPHLMKGPKTTIKSIKKHIGRRKFLLILDNCEHLQKQCKELVDELLRTNAVPNLRILVTSEEKLECRDERVFDVRPLSYPPPELVVRKLDDLRGFASVDLFFARARRDFRKERDADKHASAIATLCWLLEGIPYTIEIVAGQTNKKSPNRILDDLKSLLKERFAGAAYSHQETVHAAQEWSYSRLNDKEQMLLRQLTVFFDGWNRQGAQEVCQTSTLKKDEINFLLDRLVDASLVQVDGNREWFHLLLQTYQFADGKLTGDERAYLLCRHADYYLKLASEFTDVISDDYCWGVNKLMEGRADLYLALHRFEGIACEPSTKEELLSTLLLGAHLKLKRFEDRGYWKEFQHVVTSSMSLPRFALSKARRNAAGIAFARLSSEALTHLRLANARVVVPCNRESKGFLLDASSNADSEPDCHANAVFDRDDGPNEEAIDLVEAAKLYEQDDQFKSTTLEIRYVHLLIAIAQLYRGAFRRDEAVHSLVRALPVARNAGEPYTLMSVLILLGRWLPFLRGGGKDLGCFFEALQIAKRIDDEWAICALLYEIGDFAEDRQEWKLWRQCIGVAESVAERLEQIGRVKRPGRPKGYTECGRRPGRTLVGARIESEREREKRRKEVVRLAVNNALSFCKSLIRKRADQ